MRGIRAAFNRTGLPWWLRWWRIHLQWRRPGFDPWIGKIPWRRKWRPTPVFLPGKSHGQKNLAEVMRSQRVGHGWVTNSSLDSSRDASCLVLAWSALTAIGGLCQDLVSRCHVLTQDFSLFGSISNAALEQDRWFYNSTSTQTGSKCQPLFDVACNFKILQ